MFSQLLLIVDVRTKFEVSIFSLLGNIKYTNIKDLGAVSIGLLEFDRKSILTIRRLPRRTGYKHNRPTNV